MQYRPSVTQDGLEVLSVWLAGSDFRKEPYEFTLTFPFMKLNIVYIFRKSYRETGNFVAVRIVPNNIIRNSHSVTFDDFHFYLHYFDLILIYSIDKAFDKGQTE